LENALSEYQKVLRQDPNNVEALTGLADTYSAMANFEFIAAKDGLGQARQAAQKAIAIDRRSGRALGVLAYCDSNDLEKWLSAEPRFIAAVHLAPSDPEIRLWFGAHLGKLGRAQESIQQLKIGLLQDPTSPALNQQLATEYFYSGQKKELESQALELVRLQPFEAASHLMLARSFEQQGRYDDALESCRKAAEFHYSTAALCLQGSIEAARGNLNTAKMIAIKIQDYWEKNSFETLLLSALYCRLGNASAAIVALFGGYDRNDSSVLWAPQHPHLSVIRDEPQYRLFLVKIGLSH
jgi:Tfp pilus assembly protein PilF